MTIDEVNTALKPIIETDFTINEEVIVLQKDDTGFIMSGVPVTTFITIHANVPLTYEGLANANTGYETYAKEWKEKGYII